MDAEQARQKQKDAFSEKRRRRRKKVFSVGGGCVEARSSAQKTLKSDLLSLPKKDSCTKLICSFLVVLASRSIVTKVAKIE